LARSAEQSALLWTHNDRGNNPVLIATDEQGRLVQQVSVRASAEDWEDLESATCGEGTCLYIGDIGDNDDEREEIAVHVVAEPEPGVAQVSPELTIRARFPDGPRDAESLFVLPGGDVFIVTKGRRHDVSLYRSPIPQIPSETVTLTHVRMLFPEPQDDDDRVTAASSTPDGRWVGIRTYRTLYIYEAGALVSDRPVAPTEIDLEPLAEAQGEGLAMEDDGTVWLSSEAANRRSRAALNRLSCVFP